MILDIIPAVQPPTPHKHVNIYIYQGKELNKIVLFEPEMCDLATLSSGIVVIASLFITLHKATPSIYLFLNEKNGNERFEQFSAASARQLFTRFVTAGLAQSVAQFSCRTEIFAITDIFIS